MLLLVSVIFDEMIIAVSGSGELEVREMQAGRQCVHAAIANEAAMTLRSKASSLVILTVFVNTMQMGLNLQCIAHCA